MRYPWVMYIKKNLDLPSKLSFMSFNCCCIPQSYIVTISISFLAEVSLYIYFLDFHCAALYGYYQTNSKHNRVSNNNTENFTLTHNTKTKK